MDRRTIVPSGVQAAYLSTSHRNMVRSGLALLYAQTYWTPCA